MTAKELQTDFEKEFAALIKQGLGIPCVFPKQKTLEDIERGVGIKSVRQQDEIHPSTHWLSVCQPFIFYSNQVPKSFRGFELSIAIQESIPGEYISDEYPKN